LFAGALVCAPALLQAHRWPNSPLHSTAPEQLLARALDQYCPQNGEHRPRQLPDGRDENGRLDGRAYEGAETFTARIRPLTPEYLATAFGAAQQRYARWGVTSIHLMNNDKSLEVTLAGLAAAKPLQKWTVYSWGAWQTPAERIPDAWAVIDAAAKQASGKVRVEGPKWMLDGTPIEQNSLQRKAYGTRPGWQGRSNFTDAQLHEILKLALERPSQLALHVVGDAETDRMLKMMEELAPASAWRAKRVRIEHGDGIQPDTTAKVAEFGFVVIQNPTHLSVPIVGESLATEHMLLKSFMAAGIPLDDADRSPWLRAIGEYLRRCLAHQENTVVTCSALKESYRRAILADAPSAKLVYLKGSRELLRERISSRSGHFMKPEMLDSQLTALEEPADALVVDIAQTPDEIVAKIRQSFGI